MGDTLRGMLPPVYQPLFDAFFDRPKINETRSTCDSCAMCDKGEPSPVPMDYFLPDTKCCTFFPNLPNYLAGAILADPAPDMEEGKRRLRAQIASRKGALPTALARPRKVGLIMSGYSDGFGRARSLQCPYFDDTKLDASCTIWRHRETICLTYYCKYVHGQRGFDFWVAFKNYLGQVQRLLIKFAVEAVDPTLVEPTFRSGMLTLEDIEDLPPKEADYARWWGKWVGREEEFYIKCYEWVRSVKPEEFKLNIDQSDAGKQALADLIGKYDRIENKVLPKHLVRNARMREHHVGDKVVVTTYHRYDSFMLDKDLYEVVGMFKATETLEENLARLKSDGIELVPELIEYLFTAGVLVQPGAPKAGDSREAPGELSGRRKALAAVFSARGIVVDDLAIAKIARADITKLDAFIKRAANAKTIAEVIEEEQDRSAAEDASTDADPPAVEESAHTK